MKRTFGKIQWGYHTVCRWCRLIWFWLKFSLTRAEKQWRGSRIVSVWICYYWRSCSADILINARTDQATAWLEQRLSTVCKRQYVNTRRLNCTILNLQYSREEWLVCRREQCLLVTRRAFLYLWPPFGRDRCTPLEDALCTHCEIK